MIKESRYQFIAVMRSLFYPVLRNTFTSIDADLNEREYAGRLHLSAVNVCVTGRSRVLLKLQTPVRIYWQLSSIARSERVAGFN